MVLETTPTLAIRRVHVDLAALFYPVIEVADVAPAENARSPTASAG
jgi:hypothetical protein